MYLAPQPSPPSRQGLPLHDTMAAAATSATPGTQTWKQKRPLNIIPNNVATALYDTLLGGASVRILKCKKGDADSCPDAATMLNNVRLAPFVQNGAFDTVDTIVAARPLGATINQVAKHCSMAGFYPVQASSALDRPQSAPERVPPDIRVGPDGPQFWHPELQCWKWLRAPGVGKQHGCPYPVLLGHASEKLVLRFERQTCATRLLATMSVSECCFKITKQDGEQRILTVLRAFAHGILF